MKDKRLDALLETLCHHGCAYHQLDDVYNPICTMEEVKTHPEVNIPVYPPTSCQGDIRKCEREE